MLNTLVDGFHPTDSKDRAGLVKLLTQQVHQVDRFLCSIKARPITATRYSPDLMTPWQQLQSHPSALIDNPAEERNKTPQPASTDASGEAGQWPQALTQ